jgi:hypothetical protein
VVPRYHDLRWTGNPGVRPMNEMSSTVTGAAGEPWVEVPGSPHLAAWLAELQIGLAFTTYQSGKLFLVGA